MLLLSKLPYWALPVISFLSIVIAPVIGVTGWKLWKRRKARLARAGAAMIEDRATAGSADSSAAAQPVAPSRDNRFLAGTKAAMGRLLAPTQRRDPADKPRSVLRSGTPTLGTALLRGASPPPPASCSDGSEEPRKLPIEPHDRRPVFRKLDI